MELPGGPGMPRPGWKKLLENYSLGIFLGPTAFEKNYKKTRDNNYKTTIKMAFKKNY